jgi:hypothetical protein
MIPLMNNMGMVREHVALGTVGRRRGRPLYSSVVYNGRKVQIYE